MSSLFSAPTINYQPQGFSTPGISYAGGGTLSESPTLSGNVGSLQSTFGQQAGALARLNATVTPGFSQLRRAGLSQINTQQKATMSNLAENLSQRRILGSSFANASQSQTAAEFAQQKANFSAQSYLQELQASNQLTQEQYQASTQQYSTFINQSNIEAGIAANLTSQANSALASVATAQANLDAQNSAGIGKFFGSLLTAPGSSMFGSMFGGGAGMSAGMSADVAGAFGLDASDIGAGATMADALPALLAV